MSAALSRSPSDKPSSRKDNGAPRLFAKSQSPVPRHPPNNRAAGSSSRVAATIVESRRVGESRQNVVSA